VNVDFLYFQRYMTVIYCLPKVLKVYHIKILRHVGNIHVVVLDI